MNAFSLENKTILITGATSGIGLEIVKEVIQAGGKVIATGRNQAKLKELQQEFKDAIEVFPADLTQQVAIEQLVEFCPKIDGFVNSAGIVQAQPIRYLTQQHLQETFAINFFAPVVLIGLLDRAKKINKKASFAFISSVSADQPHKGGTTYSASKASIDTFMKVLAMEYAHREIRANSIQPAMVQTPLYEEAKEQASHDSMNEHLSHYPLGIGEPKDVANAVIYLLSDASKWVTGTILKLDGGLLLGY